jgi:GNAT superfamily N-acetyltransferase
LQDDPSPEKSLAVEVHAYTLDTEHEVLAVLHEAFGPSWGNQAFWRWKHLYRPGFSVHDVRVYRSAEKVIGCWHMAARAIRLGHGIEIASSVEGDYAMRPDWRGLGIGRDRASIKGAQTLAERGIVVRFAFTSPRLYEHIYRPKLGYRRIRTATVHYQKLISERTIRARLQRVAEQLKSRLLIQKLVRKRPLAIEVGVSGFPRCMLILDAEQARCTESLEMQPDLKVGVPYALINARTPPEAARAACWALLSGKLRVHYVARFVRRLVSSRELSAREP